MKARIIAERFPNPYRRSYHMTVEVSEKCIEIFSRPLCDNFEERFKEVGKYGREIVETLLRLDGITGVTLQPYQVNVGIGEAYEWEDIQPHIIATLKKVFVQKCEVTEDEVKVTEKYDTYKYSQ